MPPNIGYFIVNSKSIMRLSLTTKKLNSMNCLIFIYKSRHRIKKLFPLSHFSIEKNNQQICSIKKGAKKQNYGSNRYRHRNSVLDKLSQKLIGNIINYSKNNARNPKQTDIF